MKDELVARRVAGVTAILSGVAQVSWAVLNGVTQGGLDSGGASPQVVRIGQILLISWNLLLLPVALYWHAKSLWMAGYFFIVPEDLRPGRCGRVPP